MHGTEARDRLDDTGASAWLLDSTMSHDQHSDVGAGEGPLYREVRTAVRARLAELSEITRFADDATMATLARVEMPKLTELLLGLLNEHRPDSRGKCRTCKHAWFRRSADAPCRTYLTAYLHLLAIE